MDEDIESIEHTTPQEVLAAGGVSQSRRTASVGRYGARRSPTTGHRIRSPEHTRRNKSPEPYAELEDKTETKKEVTIRRTHSSPGEIVRALHEEASPRLAQRRISSTSEEEEEEEEEEEAKKRVAKNESFKRLSGVSTGSTGSNEDPQAPKRPVRRRSKSRRDSEDSTSDSKADGNGTAWWKSWTGWGTRGKSLDREPGPATVPVAVPRKRNRSLERPPSAAAKHQPPVIVRRNKSKLRTNENRRSGSTEDSSDDFWKPVGELRKRKTEEVKTADKPKEIIKPKEIVKPKEIIKTKEVVEKKEIVKVVNEKPVLKRPDKLQYKDSDKEDDEEVKDVKEEEEIKTPWRTLLFESRSQWKIFVKEHPKEVDKLKELRNRCIASLLLLLIYCGLGAMVFRFTEGAFEAFYKCGVKRVKRDFVDTLWMGSHNLREDDWKSLARRKLMDFENQLQTAYEAGMTTYSGQRAWSFLNSVIYCFTVVTTIGYGHISPSTTTGRAITIVYAIFGIPMFLILLADFGKLFTRGIKFVWAFVRRVYYTGSCKKVRRTAPMQEVMKGVQMVYDIATFRRPSQMPPGLDLTNAATEDVIQPQIQPQPRTAPFTPMEPPGTPAMSTFSIDDEFNLPISVAITILLIYIFCGATVFYIWENWGFFESFYFVFISMSTIGFGDFVPQNQMYMMASIVYLVFGLALTSMCINVVQEKLSDTFRQASAKIGATIGLRVAEEDGTVTPVAPAPVEVAEVHKPSKMPAHAHNAS